jgi:hypothetical protein
MFRSSAGSRSSGESSLLRAALTQVSFTRFIPGTYIHRAGGESARVDKTILGEPQLRSGRFRLSGLGYLQDRGCDPLCD